MSEGRPTKYKPEYDTQAYKLCLLGASDERIANFFEIAVSTLYLWKKNHPSFSEALKGGKELANANVAKSLYDRAVGYTHTEEKVFCFQGEIITHETTKHYPPETGAIALFLKNREPELWRDKQEVNVTLSDNFEDLLEDAADD